MSPFEQPLVVGAGSPPDGQRLALLRGARGALALIVSFLLLVAYAPRIAFLVSPGRLLLAIGRAGGAGEPPSPLRRVLVTGYGAWGNTTVNPAQLVAEALNATCVDGVCFEGWVVPVNTTGASRAAAALLARPDPLAAPWDAVVHIGLESSSKGLRVETMAANVKASDTHESWSANVPCNKTGTEWEPIDAAAPCLLAATLPLGAITFDSDTDGPPELWSRDAGTFYCNEALFRTLAVVRSQRLGPASSRPGRSAPGAAFRAAPGVPEAVAAPRALLPVGFIHLPTLERSPVGTSKTFVSHVAGLMVGRSLPSPSRAELLVAAGVVGQ